MKKLLFAISPDEMPKLVGEITFYVLLVIVFLWLFLKNRKK